MNKRPGVNSGKDGGIYQQQGPKGGKKPNFTTVPDNKTLPPTTKSGDTWYLKNRTPDSKK